VSLSAATAFLREHIAPNAHAIDTSVEAMGVAFTEMRKQGLMALKRPAEHGGPAISEADFRTYQEEVARASGSFAFLQTQHQSAVNMIAKQASEEIKAEYLPQMHGPKTVGIGFSQLRRTGDPICKAVETDSGYILNGEVPWITGLGFFDEYLIGSVLPDGRAVFGFMPFANVEGQMMSEPMRLAAMETCQTVTARLTDYHLSNDQVAFINDKDWMRKNDAFNIVVQGHFAVGCALAGADIVQDVANKKGFNFLHETAKKLYAEIEECRTALVAHQKDFAEDTAPLRLEKRAWAIDLMMRCAHAGVVASSGAANYHTHPAQRVLREAIVFSVSAQTGPIMEATLSRLTRL
jgi:hypothetical protein